ncbi:MAG: hypothetical protein VX839_00195, partial [Verrucomicrobiota bacterium]|nr:hypothetical protein [Verrucomicrobiota bacterium]
MSDVKCWNRSIPSYGDLSRSIDKTYRYALVFENPAKRRRMCGRFDHSQPIDHLEKNPMVLSLDLPIGICPLLQLKVGMKMKASDT